MRRPRFRMNCSVKIFIQFKSFWWTLITYQQSRSRTFSGLSWIRSRYYGNSPSRILSELLHEPSENFKRLLFSGAREKSNKKCVRVHFSSCALLNAWVINFVIVFSGDRRKIQKMLDVNVIVVHSCCHHQNIVWQIHISYYVEIV